MEDYKAVCQDHLVQPEAPHLPSEKSVSPSERCLFLRQFISILCFVQLEVFLFSQIIVQVIVQENGRLQSCLSGPSRPARAPPPHSPNKKSVSPSETQQFCGSLVISRPTRDRAHPASRPFWLVKFRESKERSQFFSWWKRKKTRKLRSRASCG